MIEKAKTIIKENEDMILFCGTLLGAGMIAGVCGYTLGYTDGFAKGMVTICDGLASLAKAAP